MQCQINHATVRPFNKHGQNEICHEPQTRAANGNGIGIRFGHELTCRTSGHFSAASAGSALALCENIMKNEKAENMRTNCHHLKEHKTNT